MQINTEINSCSVKTQIIQNITCKIIYKKYLIADQQRNYQFLLFL